jgi:magnesium chelatase family protein
VRPAALIGRAETWGVRPGEFSLAHGGLLLADELPEWQRDSREALREPLERGFVTLTRARQSVELPARFTLAANGNLCACGGWPPELPSPLESAAGKIAHCTCTPRSRALYLARLSGPVLDRLDLVGISARQGERANQVDAPKRLSELRKQVERSRARAIAQWGKLPTRMGGAELEALLETRKEWKDALDPAKFASLRTRHKILRVALTLAAWDGLDEPTQASFVEAAFYRPERYGLPG